MKVRQVMVTFAWDEMARSPFNSELEKCMAAALANCPDLGNLSRLDVALMECGRYDQYGEPVPSDLVLLPSPGILSEEGVKKVEGAEWYEAEHEQFKNGGFLLASAEALGDLSEDDLHSATGVREETCLWHRVAHCLKRWSAEDGFYHA
mgnify:CR=1 FL=1